MLAAMAIMSLAATAIALTIAFLILTMAAAAACAHLASHSFCHLFVGGGTSLVDCHAKVLIDCSEHQIQLFTRLQKALAALVVDDIAAQLVELRQFLLPRWHAGCSLLLKLRPVLAYLAKELRGGRILIE